MNHFAASKSCFRCLLFNKQTPRNSRLEVRIDWIFKKSSLAKRAMEFVRLSSSRLLCIWKSSVKRLMEMDRVKGLKDRERERKSSAILVEAGRARRARGRAWGSIDLSTSFNIYHRYTHVYVEMFILATDRKAELAAPRKAPIIGYSPFFSCWRSMYNDTNSCRTKRRTKKWFTLLGKKLRLF